MPTWVIIRNNRHGWVNVSVARVKTFLASYGRILEANIFDAGSKESLLFENLADAESFVDEMTFSFPGLPFGSRLGASIR